VIGTPEQLADAHSNVGGRAESRAERIEVHLEFICAALLSIAESQRVIAESLRDAGPRWL
jgi:hypothetical protein